MPNNFDLLRYAATGIAAPDMTAYDKARALAIADGKPITTITGVPPLSFKSDGKPVSVTISGNTVQSGTPTPDSPVAVFGCGEWDSTESSYKIPVSCGGTTTPVYLGTTQTVRRIKKLVLTGEENWTLSSINQYGIANFQSYSPGSIVNSGMSTHFKLQKTTISTTREEGILFNAYKQYFIRIFSTTADSVDALKQFLRDEYAAGHPVTVWYVLSEPETGITNEPLMKIGDYADTVSASIRTAKGANTLTVGTTVQPSEVSITGSVKPTT